MRRTLFVLSMVVALALLMSIGAKVQAACPSPVPTCESGGDVGDFIGTFGCTIVTTLSNGQVNVALAQIVSDGSGHIMTFTTVTNNNGSGSTFSPWTTGQFNGGTYCLSPDESGYVFPPSSSSVCPFAIFVDISGYEVRLMDSTSNTAGAAVCELQQLVIP
jgi:hypothetical protein